MKATLFATIALAAATVVAAPAHAGVLSDVQAFLQAHASDATTIVSEYSQTDYAVPSTKVPFMADPNGRVQLSQPTTSFFDPAG